MFHSLNFLFPSHLVCQPYFPQHLYQLPRQYAGSSIPAHVLPRTFIKTGYSKDPNIGTGKVPSLKKKQGSASVVSGTPSLLLSSMSTEVVCERVRLIDGMDQSMLSQYTATIKKANINGRVLSQCVIDELKKEMNMNFGDWQLFRTTVMELRQVESQVLHEEAPSEQGSIEPSRHAGSSALRGVGNTDTSPMYNFNLSFEELSNVGIDEPPRHVAPAWMATHRTPSMSSLNSQESSNEICKLTDKQQAEYRNAYEEYIASMSQIELGSGMEKPMPPFPGVMPSSSEDKRKDGVEQDGRKTASKRGSTKSATDTTDYPTGDTLDPITEEDEKVDHGSSKSLLGRKTSGEKVGLFQGADLKLKAAGGLRYQKLTSDDEESEESDNAPLLKDGKKPEPKASDAGDRAFGKGKDYLSDKKDSSDSGVRSNESSPNHSLQDEEADLSQSERANLIELDEENLARKRGLPNSLSGLQDPAIARMSICSEDQCSLLASSPEESWPSSKSYNLNLTPNNTTLNNNTNAQQGNNIRQPTDSSTTTGSDVIITPSSSTTQNENVRVVHLKRGLNPGDPPEILRVSSDTVTFGEERESIL